ncbi:MAG: EAL domain-containing protein [Steroidobacteraceae bacterium]
MTVPAMSHPTGSSRAAKSIPAAAEEALARLQAALDAALVGIELDGASHCLTRDVPGALVLRDLWRHGALGLVEQVRATTDGLLGTNRLRGERDGPVCGKLLAAALRDASGAMKGILVAARTVDQPKLGAAESRQLLDLAAELAKQLWPPPTPGGLLSWSTFKEFALKRESTPGALPGCVLYGDVDQLHVLNKLAGLTAGDHAIAAVGEALLQHPLPQGAEVCHLSGDRFAVYLPDSSLSQGRRVAEQLCEAVGARCAVITGLRTRLSISFGVATVPPRDPELTQALAAAEAACRAAKDRGRSRVELYQDADFSIIRRNDDVLIAARLHKALETHQFAIVAQPLVSLTGDSRTEYYELLVRLISETGTSLSPAQFIPAAARYQMLIELDRAILTAIFRQLRAAHQATPQRVVRFSVNLSGPSIGNPDFLEWLSSSVGPASVPGEWLQFELTETAAVANVSQTQSLIKHLKSRGADFALDDFGTGVSSLAYLKAFDVSMLKLDGSFTRDLLTDSRTESLVRGVAQLGRSMNIQTVAEWVETDLICDRLKELGIDRAQGFLFGQPVPLESVLNPTEKPTAAEKSVRFRNRPRRRRAPSSRCRES